MRAPKLRSRRSSLLNAAKDPVRRLLDEGDALLGAGRGDAAALAFERVLLHDPAHAEARLGLEQARAAVVEAERRSESCIDEAERAVDAGRMGRRAGAARTPRSAERPTGARALALADRLDRRSGRMAVPRAVPGRIAVPRPSGERPRTGRAACSSRPARSCSGRWRPASPPAGTASSDA